MIWPGARSSSSPSFSSYTGATSGSGCRRRGGPNPGGHPHPRGCRPAPPAAVAAREGLRDLFLATAGHEFKTPITVIQGAVELLHREKRLGEEDPQIYALLREIQGSCRQLTTLVTDVIDLANIEPGRVTRHMESSDLNLLTQNALESLRPIAARFDISVEESYASGLPSIQADRIKLRYPFVQLLSGILRIAAR